MYSPLVGEGGVGGKGTIAMSKKVKEMLIDALRQDFDGVRDFVLLEPNKVDADLDYNVRKTLREKNIRLRLVKNTLARKALEDQGIRLADNIWAGSTLVAWGADSLKSLSKAIDAILKEANKDPKKGERYRVKTAVADGQPVGFDMALKMPTRLEAIGQIVAALLGPAAQIASQITGPAAQIASQLEKIGEKGGGEPAAGEQPAAAEQPAAG